MWVRGIPQIEDSEYQAARTSVTTGKGECVSLVHRTTNSGPELLSIDFSPGTLGFYARTGESYRAGVSQTIEFDTRNKKLGVTPEGRRCYRML